MVAMKISKEQSTQLSVGKIFNHRLRTQDFSLYSTFILNDYL